MQCGMPVLRDTATAGLPCITCNKYINLYQASRPKLQLASLQYGDDPNYIKVAACSKHYAVHDGPESDPVSRLVRCFELLIVTMTV